MTHAHSTGRAKVRTDSGDVLGLRLDDLLVWRGIPYAAAPTGPRRWAPPAPAPSWSGVREAAHFGARAPQRVPTALVPPAGGVPTDDDTPFDENCLHLNICAPEHTPPRGAPVLVWIHGGGFHFGSGANVIGDGAAFARAGIVVVSLNYRLGALGFLDLSALLGPSYSESGNAGLLDQIAALSWVRDNIRAFGGDPTRVTVAGVSAGAKSVTSMMAAPRAAGLFQRGISQSGGENVTDRRRATDLARMLVDTLGVRPEHLLDVSAQDLLAAQHHIATGPSATWVWRPVAGTASLPRRPRQALAAGSAPAVALLAGTTRCEADSYAAADPTALDQLSHVLGEVFGDATDEALERYRRADPDCDEFAIACAAMTDERYGAPTLQMLDAQAAHAETWRYRVEAVDPGPDGLRSARHGADVPLVWDIGLASRSPETRALGRAMREAWASFVHSGTPRSERLPQWRTYQPDSPSTLIFDLSCRVEHALSDTESLWRHLAWTPGTWWPLPEPEQQDAA